MKLVNAKLYEDEIKEKMWEIWYDPSYQYYFGNGWRNDFAIRNNEYQRRDFAVLDDKDELIGYINYSIDSELNLAQWFGAINFSDNKIAFGKALVQVIKDCFLKFGVQTVEWAVIKGNPIEATYDRLCKKYGGRIVGIRHRRAKDLAGNFCDDKIYELLREDFMKSLKR